MTPVEPATLTWGQLLDARNSLDERLCELAKDVLAAALSRDRAKSTAALQRLCDAINAKESANG